MSEKLIQDLHSGISRRDWSAVETAANQLRDEVDRTTRVLAGTDIGSLPNDFPLSKLAASIVEKRDRLMNIGKAAHRLAYVVRKSVNAGPVSNDPTAEGQAWRALRQALGENYDEKGELLP